MITLRIFIMGLVALVPDHGAGKVTLLIQDATHACQRHVPVLIYNPGQRVCMQGESNCPEGEALSIACALNRSAPSPGFFLEGVDIDIEQAEASGVRFAQGGFTERWYHHLLGVVPSSRNIAADVDWIPKMDAIASQSATVRPDLMDPATLSPDLAARLTLSGGELSTFGFAEVVGKKSPIVRSMTFKRLGSGMRLISVKHALADLAVVVLEINNDEVVLTLNKRESGERRRLVLKPNGSREVDILLGNLTPLTDGVNPTSPAEHFALYSKLSAAPLGVAALPIPHLGWRKKDRGIVESATIPFVIQAVSEPIEIPAFSRDFSTMATSLLGGLGSLYKLRQEVCNDDDGGQGGTDRPICTLVEMR